MGHASCSFFLINFIIKNYYANSQDLSYSRISITRLKQDLIDEYINYDYFEAIIYYNKNSLLDDIKELFKTKDSSKKRDFIKPLSDAINNDDYILSYIDIYLL